MTAPSLRGQARGPAGPLALPPVPSPSDHWVHHVTYGFLSATTEVEARRAVPAAIQDDPDALAFTGWLSSLPARDRALLANDPVYADPGSLLDDWPALSCPLGGGVGPGLRRLKEPAPPRRRRRRPPKVAGDR